MFSTAILLLLLDPSCDAIDAKFFKVCRRYKMSASINQKNEKLKLSETEDDDVQVALAHLKMAVPLRLALANMLDPVD